MPAQAVRNSPSPLIPFVLITASSVSILSTDLYVPSLPHLPGYFGTDASTAQLTMSLNMLGFALSQLFFGPLSDRIGRRKTLLFGIIGLVAASLACAAAATIGQLIGARVLQGILASSEAVVALAVIRDLYTSSAAVRILGAYGMAIALAPAVGPVIGGFVHVWLGWQANFILTALLATIVVVMIWRLLPETTTPDRQALKPARLLAGYGRLLTQWRFMADALLCAAMLAGLFALITAAPFVFIDRLGVATEHYGLYTAVMVLAYFFGSLAANRFAGRIGLDRMLVVAIGILLIGGMAMPLCLLIGLETPIALTVAASLYTFGMGPGFATAPVRALEAAQGSPGIAAALIGTLEMTGGASGAFVVGMLHDGSAWPMAGTLAVAAMTAGLLCLDGARRPSAA